MILASCQNENSKVEEEFGGLDNQLIESLSELGSKKETFEINLQQINTIVCKNGTTLIIPKNSIVDQKEKVIEGNILIEVKENFQIPQNELNQEVKIFLGQRNQNGKINWGEQDGFSKALIPYPISFISRNKFPTECSDYFGITTDTSNKYFYNYYGNILDYENTFIATQEFSYRYHSTCWDSVVHIYVNNLDLNLWEADELVLNYFVRDSIRRVGFQVNYVPPNPKGGERTQQQKDAHQWLVNSAKESASNRIQTYKYFANQKLTKIDTTKMIDTTKLKGVDEFFLSYDALDFGWINVDFFYENPNSEKVKLIAKSNKSVPIVNLIFKDRMVILSGEERENLKYYFTKEEDGYNKLPKGEKAIIMAMGYEKDNIIFDDKEIIIGEKEVYELNLKEIDKEELKEKMKKYGS